MFPQGICFVPLIIASAISSGDAAGSMPDREMDFYPTRRQSTRKKNPFRQISMDKE